MTQFEKFLTPDNFKLAFIRLKTAQKNLYKSIYYEDLKIFQFYLDENIATVIFNIEQDIYKPEKCHKIFIPKKDNLVRPLSMLTFIDMLIYQAITNVIADVAYDVISPYYNNVIFGNIVNPSNSHGDNKNFFYRSWKRKWKRFNEISKENLSSGYVYLSEFDIASFFDTIDHNILCELLRNDYKIENEILELLSVLLGTWTADSNHKSFNSKHGIPQGPLSSPFLADLYLFYIDREIRRTTKKLDYKYLRYVDDIRIFTKDELTSKKLIAALDLVSRDLGLIPQGSKILITKVEQEEIEKVIKSQNTKFSDITNEYKEETLDKESGRLKARTHRKLKKRFENCFIEGTDEEFLDKTLIAFSLFKLNADDGIKSLIIREYNLILPHFAGVLFYLKKHFPNDEEVKLFVGKILVDETILFKHLVALCLKYFPEYPFDDEVYQMYTSEKHRHWLLNYYMVGWAFANNKKELLLSDNSTNNYFIQRELNSFKYSISSESSFRRAFVSRLLVNQNNMLSLQGLNLLSENFSDFISFKPSKEHNQFIRHIFDNQPENLIVHTLKNDWKIENSEAFFNDDIWNNDQEREELRKSFLLFIKAQNSDPSKSLLNLNIFNNLVFDKVCVLLKIQKTHTDYGVNLNSNLINDYLPICNNYWKEINEKRNQKTEAHPYDKSGKIRIIITTDEFNNLYKKQKLALEEICNFPKFKN